MKSKSTFVFDDPVTELNSNRFFGFFDDSALVQRMQRINGLRDECFRYAPFAVYLIDNLANVHPSPPIIF